MAGSGNGGVEAVFRKRQGGKGAIGCPAEGTDETGYRIRDTSENCGG
jgi:hypothetical protein